MNKENNNATVLFPETFDYEIYKNDKFIYSIPKKGFYFTENDFWVYIIGNKARIGVTDYVKHYLSHIVFVDLAAVGSNIEQFGEVGVIESAKLTFEIVSPISGIITAINDKLLDKPELINENPYEKGWIAELEPLNFQSDKKLLFEFDKYFEIIKKKKK